MTAHIENRTAVLDEHLRLIEAETSREFFSYFDFRVDYIPDCVHEDDRQKFISLMNGTEPERSAIIRFLRNTGEYKYNLVSVSAAGFGVAGRISLLEIDEALAFNRMVVSEARRMRKVLSITDEYMFSYRKADGIFTIVHYDQDREIVSYKMELDAWQTHVTENGLVPESELSKLEMLVSNLSVFPSSFTVKMNCGIRTGSSVCEQLRFIGVRSEDGDDVYMLGRILSDESLRQIRHARNLLDELQLDALTQVYNKKTITAYAMQRIRAALPERFALVIVDLDHFKPVNDQYGHMAGDKVLSRAAAKIKEVVGDDGMVGRFGGDEFMLILNDMDNPQILRGMLRAVMVQIRTEFEGNFEGISITCSIGAAVYPTNGLTYDDLFKKADFCLYRAKEKGRDRYVFFRDDLHAQLYKASQEAKNAGAKTEGREMQELKYMAQFMQQLGSDRRGAILSVMRHMLGTYAVDCITVYQGSDMRRVTSVGIERPEFANARYALGDDFKRVLGGQNFVRIDFPEQVTEDMGAFYTEVRRRNICSTIQCVIGTQDNIQGLVSFDKIHAPAKWAEYEVNCAVLFAGALGLLR